MKKILTLLAATLMSVSMFAEQQDISLDVASWGWGYNSNVSIVDGVLKCTTNGEWGAASTGWDPSTNLSGWDRIVVVVESMSGCDGEWFKLKAYLRDNTESEENQMEGILSLDAEDNAQNHLEIDLHQEKDCDLTQARVLAIQCQPNGAQFTISRVYLEKDASGGNNPMFPDDPGTLTYSLELKAAVVDGDELPDYVPSGGGGYAKGSSVTITAQNIPGYAFVRWSDEITDNPRTIVLNESMTLTALYSHSMIEIAIAAGQWNFICLPPLGDRQYTEDMFTYDGLTGVKWGTYNGSKRAASQSGWETPETFNALQGYILYSTTAGTLRINAYEDDIRQGESGSAIYAGMTAYASSHPENESWNFLGNPYSQGYNIAGIAAAGIESPITVWNGTAYSTYTPGIDEYTLQPFEAFFIQKAEGGTEGITFSREYLDRDVEGALSGYFTVGESTKVRFSKGNLQYQASTDTWQFAANQYDYIGDANSNISSTYDGWIDLFGFGTGNNPTKSVSNYSDYSTFTDWGVNAISNGGNEANQWRTLTTDEWLYLIYSRTDAANLFGLGSVNGVSGLIILPDNWTTPQGVSFTPSTTQGIVNTGVYYSNTNGDNFSHNTYTAAQWSVMEQSGAIFLPVTGYRWGTGMDYVGTTGYYWSTTPYNDGYGRSLYFDSNYFYPQGNNDRFLGLSVRLVR